jgi:hypothetical protein
MDYRYQFSSSSLVNVLDIVAKRVPRNTTRVPSAVGVVNTHRSKSEIIQTLNIIGNSRLPLLGLEPSRSVFKKSLPGFSLGLLRAIFAIFDGPCIHENT